METVFKYKNSTQWKQLNTTTQHKDIKNSSQWKQCLQHVMETVFKYNDIRILRTRHNGNSV